MKIKWLIILFIIFVGVILISLLISQQNNNITLLSEKATSQNTQSIDYSPIQPLSITPIVIPRSSVKSGISVIKNSQKKPENQIPPAQVEKDIEAVINAPPKNNSSSIATQQEDIQQAGITIIGKHPTPKEAKEMNSAGIVMY